MSNVTLFSVKLQTCNFFEDLYIKSSEVFHQQTVSLYTIHGKLNGQLCRVFEMKKKPPSAAAILA